MGQAERKGWNAGVEESGTCGPKTETERFGSKTDCGRTAAGTRGAGIRDGIVDEPTRGRFDRTGMRGSVQHRACVAHSARSGMELPTADWKSVRARRKGHSTMETGALA